MVKNLKIVAIVQARMSSQRLLGKVMKEISQKPLIELLLMRLSRAENIDEIILATSSNNENKILIDHVTKLGFKYYVGSEDDVLGRYYEASLISKADVVVRVTGDCPLICPSLVDQTINVFINSDSKYLCNIDPPTFPDGLDIEVFSKELLEEANKFAKSSFDREHVTPYMKKKFSNPDNNLTYSEDLSSLRWTVDTKRDLKVVRNVFEYFEPDIFFSWLDVLKIHKTFPNLFKENLGTERNIGSHMNKGQKLWSRAKNIIPGGNMLLSKRPEMFLPDKWPVYYSSSKGCEIIDLDGTKYIDMSLMGVGTNILGYSNDEINKEVSASIDEGNMTTLNCPEEVYLAERLINMHPWADMVKFARSGGEANAISVRIARASVGKDNVAVCGYHGWHDWYLSVNLGNNNALDSYLLPGLEPKGVPRNLESTVFPFEYGDFKKLEELVSSRDIGVIKMEVSRNSEPDVDFLRKIRALANKKNIVLIFDECTSGFRQSFGGIHLLTGVEPDLAIFGKALGNGYAITAIIGRQEVMQAAQTTFISSTFWTERSGYVAALKTLEIMERLKSWEIITEIGVKIKKEWKKLAKKHSLDISICGIPSLAGFTIQGKNSLVYKTLISQEMLKRGFLASNSVYSCIDHNDTILQKYFENIEPIFEQIKKCKDGLDINSLLEGPVCHDGFKRLN